MGKIATIYAGRHHLYMDNDITLVDSFQAVVIDEEGHGRTVVQCHLYPKSDDYKARGAEMADFLKARNEVDGFIFRNSYLYHDLTEKAIRKDILDFEECIDDLIRGVLRTKLREFRGGLLKRLIGV